MVKKIFEFGEEGVKAENGLVQGKFERADELDDMTAEALFEAVDAVTWDSGAGGESLETIEVVAPKTVFESVFDHVPLDEILSVVFFHVGLVAARIEVDNLGAD